MSVSNAGQSGDETINIYANKFGSSTNWFGPSDTYHEDGIIFQAQAGGGNVYDYVFNNDFTGSLTGGNTTAEIFLTLGRGTGSGAPGATSVQSSIT